ncbi:MAG: histidine phosphatase family protein [Lachnospiraceae bacterium]|nr:histidine phosphatase family protein [Lachnospiraceae bacterium]
MELYITRHGQTDWNVLNKVLGRTDIPLNKTGIKQAHDLADTLRYAYFDHIFTSPYSRAKTTGEIVAESKEMKVETLDWLMECDFGEFEGTSRTSEVYQAAKHEVFKRYPGGESFLDIAARVYPGLMKLKEDYPDKCILLVTHGGICRMIRSYFEDLGNDEFIDYSIGNCEVLHYTF